MGQTEPSLSGLGRHVADEQDASPEALFDAARGRARWLGVPLPRARHAAARPRVTRVIAPLAAAFAIVAALVFWSRARAPLRFEVGAATPGLVGDWIAAPPSAELPVRFSDGSVLRLAADGRARVVAIGADGAEIALERGALDLAVIHRDATQWLVRVGPFRVDVIGTRFATRWEPSSERLEIELYEGVIAVSGPVVGERRAVRAGERLRVSAAKGTLEVGSVASADAATATAPLARDPARDEEDLVSEDPVIEDAPRDASPAPAKARVAADVMRAPVAAPRERSSWRALSRDAKYKEALAAAEEEGFDRLCASVSARDLQVLGDAARLGGDAARAEQALGALRARFPGSPEAADSAFLLGKIAQDRSKDQAAAAAWFHRYLAEQPRGELAADAAGRLVEAADEMGDDAGARAAAQRYLAAYPDGAHAAYAKGVLARAPRP